ncbi:GNAT family N-acetyltransferase [Cognatiluteimonas profundi]|uniref:GNAT family N-acetyltransferase n=1 Tax=Cognatiluteimonas profundi TaxID=2594501 RepID=UPI00131E6BDA|nr:GNAT family N-acetyltransferase [Lysobacter profundi]
MNITASGLNTTHAPDYPRWSETLRDRSHVVIRPMGSQDREEERAFIEGLSPQSRHFRFLGQVCRPSDRLLDQLTDVDNVHDVAFAAVTHEDSRERIVGVGRYSANTAGDVCECAVTVSDDWQGKGLGTLLMKHLIEVARARGIHRMYSVDSAENVRMTELAGDLGFLHHVDPDDASQLIHELLL